LVGAIPGALPCLIGWTAGEAQLSIGGWVLFGIQFLWQFPHFWAIAWVAHTDYSAVGFKLLPADKGPTKFTALQAVIYSLLLLPVTLLPYFVGGQGYGAMCSYDDIPGIISIGLILVANVFMIMRSIKLYQDMEVSSARRVMFGSYMYLPVVLLALLMSKI
jgi:protoheme IX farnesyltransferase